MSLFEKLKLQPEAQKGMAQSALDARSRTTGIANMIDSLIPLCDEKEDQIFLLHAKNHLSVVSDDLNYIYKALARGAFLEETPKNED